MIDHRYCVSFVFVSLLKIGDSGNFNQRLTSDKGSDLRWPSGRESSWPVQQLSATNW